MKACLSYIMGIKFHEVNRGDVTTLSFIWFVHVKKIMVDVTEKHNTCVQGNNRIFGTFPYRIFFLSFLYKNIKLYNNALNVDL